MIVICSRNELFNVQSFLKIYFYYLPPLLHILFVQKRDVEQESEYNERNIGQKTDIYTYVKHGECS